MDRYTDAVLAAMRRYAAPGRRADTLYFGGGTPSLLGGERIARLIRGAEEHFSLFSGKTPEITMEANPADRLDETFAAFAAAGGNRVSLGMQSSEPEELRLLGRRHTPEQVTRSLNAARRAGIDNLSLDLMIGIAGQTEQTVMRSVDFLAEAGVRHASAYLLKLEPGTPYGKHPPQLPDGDEAAALYQTAAQRLEARGYRQYEISNFAVPGKESRHNLKYWDSLPYLGLGPAASSFLDGKRFSYPRDVRSFLAGEEPVEESDDLIPADSEEEYALLRLRLTDGLERAAFFTRFGHDYPSVWDRRAKRLPPSLLTADGDGIRLTRDGFLVSNPIIETILAI